MNNFKLSNCHDSELELLKYDVQNLLSSYGPNSFLTESELHILVDVLEETFIKHGILNLEFLIVKDCVTDGVKIEGLHLRDSIILKELLS